MTGYDRCLAAIKGEQPDRVPAYTPTIASDVASQILGRSVHTGGPELWFAEAVAWSNGPAAWQEFDAQIMEDIMALNQALDQDVIRFPWRNNIRPTARIDEKTFRCGKPEDKNHQIWRWDESVMNFIPCRQISRPPVSWAARARRAEQSLEEEIAQSREHAGVRDVALQQRVGDRMMAIAAGPGLSLGVTEEALIATIQAPEAVEALLDCRLEIGLARLAGFAARGVKVILGGGDMADKNGPLYSPAMFRRFMQPRWKKLADYARQLNLHYVWRSDGNLWQVADMLFLESRLEDYGEVDYDAGMTTAKVRECYPNLVIWGNLSGDLLRRGTPEDVYSHARQALEGSGGTRYFHGCSNTILPGSPPENVFAMMQARDDFSLLPDV